MRKVPAVGPRNARIIILGEAPGQTEEERLIPFIGSAGMLLDQFLAKAGINRDECYITNVCKYRPPGNDLWRFFYSTDDAKASNKPCIRGLYPNEYIIEGLQELEADIAEIKPHLIIALGNYALWATSNLASIDDDEGYKVPGGITKWRASMLPPSDCLYNVKLMPIIHPSAILRMWEWKNTTAIDFCRARDFAVRREFEGPARSYILRPNFGQVKQFFNHLEYRLHGSGPVYLAVDIETRARHIACIGLATSTVNAICIPFMCLERPASYWSVEEEKLIAHRLHQILKHPNCRVIGQNFAYDIQYLTRRYGLYFPVHHDTLLAQHVLYPGTQKDLAYLASVHCHYYKYWKDDGKNWEDKIDEDQLWEYNCDDAVYTFEVFTSQNAAIESEGFSEQFKFIMSLFDPVVKMMLRGVKIDETARGKMMFQLLELLNERETWFKQIIPNIKLAKSKNAKPWYRSTKQQKTLFYDLMCLPMQKKRGTGKPTVEDAALAKLAQKEPIIRPIVRRLAEYRSLGVFANTFVDMSLDHDGRARCSYNIGGTETFRFSSSTDAFDYGLNLQNIPKGNEDE